MALHRRVRDRLRRRPAFPAEPLRATPGPGPAGRDADGSPDGGTIRAVRGVAILTMALVLTLAAGVASRFLDLERSAAEMAEATMPSLALVEHVRSDVLEHHGLLLAHVLATDPAAMDTLEEAMAVLEADVPTDIDEITAVGVHPEDDVRAAEAKSAWQAYVEAARAVTALSRGSGAAASAGTLLGQAEPVFGVVLAELEVWAAHEEAAAAHELAEVRASIDEALLLIGVGILLTALLLFGAARLAERSVARSTAVSTSLLRSALVLNRFTELSAISDDDEELARLSLNSLAALAGAENGILHLSNASADRARPLASLGDPPTIALTLGDLGRCPGLRTGSVHATEDAGGALSIRCPAYPVDSGRLLCVPLAAHGQAIGTIHLHWSGRAASSQSSWRRSRGRRTRLRSRSRTASWSGPCAALPPRIPRPSSGMPGRSTRRCTARCGSGETAITWPS